jgi:hypothetical protein
LRAELLDVFIARRHQEQHAVVTGETFHNRHYLFGFRLGHRDLVQDDDVTSLCLGRERRAQCGVPHLARHLLPVTPRLRAMSDTAAHKNGARRLP